MTSRRSTLLPEIQALRALAVALVLGYHFWPGIVRGGFVGVDVFFAVSGFLITAQIVREAQREGTVRLGRFWAKRARRLLPASLLVLAVVAAAIFVVVPRSLWQQFFVEVATSALYAQNWLLAANSTDYLAAQNAASPVQHFWTLSVEEQFYLVWPILILAAVFVAGRVGRRGSLTAITITIGAVTAASFAYAVLLTAAIPSVAYFDTFARMWEFGAGGLLALAMGRAGRVATGGGPGLRAAVSWAGLALVVGSSLLYTGATPFPGLAPAAPVIGALAVIWAGLPAPAWSPAAVMRLRPVQFAGDISYALYLWHWPLLILAGYVVGGSAELGVLPKLLLIGATVALAAATTRFVEDPIRRSTSPTLRRPLGAFAASALGMLLVAGIAASGWGLVQRDVLRTNELADELQAAGGECFGAAALTTPAPGCTPGPLESIVPAPAAANTDRPDIYTDECRSQPTDPVVRACEFGGNSTGLRVALIGDSHAASWFPAIESLALNQGWQLHTFFKATCAFLSAERIKVDSNPRVESSCRQWNRDLSTRLADAEPYDLVFTAHYAAIGSAVDASGEPPEQAAIDGFRSAWTPLIERGAQLIALRDTPAPGAEGVTCLQENPSAPSLCDFPLTGSLADDRSQRAAAGLDGAHAVDMTDYFCPDSTCRAVIGDVFVYRDADHFTATYSRSLAGPLLREFAGSSTALVGLLGDGGPPPN